MLMTNKPDPLKELDAMKKVAEVLKDLEPDSVRRVVEWTCDHFDVRLKKLDNQPDKTDHTKEDSSKTNETTEHHTESYNDVADFYTTASPSTDAEKVLIVTYWKQVYEEAPDVDSYSVNKELKDLGHGIGNVTRAFTTLQKSKPQLALQSRKHGTSQQARKKYRITGEGKKYVENMLTKDS